MVTPPLSPTSSHAPILTTNIYDVLREEEKEEQEDNLKWQVSCHLHVNADEYISVHLAGIDAVSPPTVVESQRKKGIKKVKTDMTDWMLKETAFQFVLEKVGEFQETKGLQPVPDFRTEWWDGCCDVLGTNKQLPLFCSPQNSFFSQSWVGKNVYVNAPFHTTETREFLRRYLRDAKLAKERGQVTRGVFIVPVWQSAPWWHLTAMFHTLHVWKKGVDDIFSAPAGQEGEGRHARGGIPFDVAILYDPGQVDEQKRVEPILHSIIRRGTTESAGYGSQPCSTFVLSLHSGSSRDAKRRAKSRLLHEWEEFSTLSQSMLSSLRSERGGRAPTLEDSVRENFKLLKTKKKDKDFVDWGVPQENRRDAPQAWPPLPKIEWTTCPLYILENLIEASKLQTLQECREAEVERKNWQEEDK